MKKAPKFMSIERQLGFSLAGAAFWFSIKHRTDTVWAVIGALVTLVLLGVAIRQPYRLSKAARVWMGFGHVLEKIMSPVVMAVVFGLVFTPMGVIARIFGHDPLRLKERDTETHWIKVSKRPTNFNRMY